MEEIKFLHKSGMYLVAHHIGRHYPGVLIQGDTLKLLYDNLAEAVEEIAKDPREGIEFITYIQEELLEHLVHYEEVLKENGIDLPYGTSVMGNKKSKQ